MMLTPERVAEFKELCKKELGLELTDEQAYDYAIKFLRMMEIVYRPMTKADMAAVEARRKELGIDKAES